MVEKSNQTDFESENDSVEIVTWEEKYATGIELIDNQHKELFNLTNQLHRACLGGVKEAVPVFLDTMNMMVHYFRFHFGAEEKLMERINYPDYQKHKQQHDTLEKNIYNSVKEFKEGNKSVTNNVVKILKEWVFDHIAVYDIQYASYIADQKKKGLLSDQQING